MSWVSGVLLNWKVFLLIFSFNASIFITNTRYAILPISGCNFILCSITVWFLSLWITLISLQKLLSHNKPLELDLKSEDISKLADCQAANVKPNSERIKKLAEDIDRFFITNWYCVISKDEDFTKESRVVLEEVIKKLLEAQNHVNNKVLLHGVLNIYLKHLKGFRRSLKRKEKYGNSNVIEQYRYSHLCSTSNESKEFFVHQLTTNLLNHFVNWELWNSLPCHILVGIIARKLTAFILNLISSPKVLNYYFLKALASADISKKYKLEDFNRIAIGTLILQKQKADDIADCIKVEPKLEEQKPVEQITKEIIEKPVIKPKAKSLIVEASTSSSNISKPVKIYEPKSTSTSKTWNEYKDLASISFGTDPLDIFNIPDTVKAPTHSKKNFWESSGSVKSDDSIESPTATNMLLNEVKQITQSEGFKTFSDATVHTLHNIKDLQETTVNNALHKIGDFQDEAAGVVEGLLDFGRAGFRKGLRLTGLQDNVETAKVLQLKKEPVVKKKLAKMTRSGSDGKMSSDDSGESVWVNPLQLESPNFDGQILLEKTPNKPETEMKMLVSDETDRIIPSIAMDENESPDPEYEEAADLASTIAKLRSLLAQKSSESSFSTPAISPMPPEDFSQNVLLEGGGDLPDGVMPSFYKFCAKTATGVFQNTVNTLKTALPRNVPGSDAYNNRGNWIFVQADYAESDLLMRVKKLVTERKDFCMVDTAYEAIDSIDSLQTGNESSFKSQLQFEDELDDFEVKLPITKVLVDIICELLADTETPFLQEPMVKAVLLLFGIKIEKFINKEVDNLKSRFSNDLFTIPETTSINILTLNFDEYVDAVLNSIPDYIKHILGKEALKKALDLFVQSIQEDSINQDVILQIFELLCMLLIDESLLTPPASA